MRTIIEFTLNTLYSTFAVSVITQKQRSKGGRDSYFKFWPWKLLISEFTVHHI